MSRDVDQSEVPMMFLDREESICIMPGHRSDSEHEAALEREVQKANALAREQSVHILDCAQTVEGIVTQAYEGTQRMVVAPEIERYAAGGSQRTYAAGNRTLSMLRVETEKGVTNIVYAAPTGGIERGSKVRATIIAAKPVVLRDLSSRPAGPVRRTVVFHERQLEGTELAYLVEKVGDSTGYDRPEEDGFLARKTYGPAPEHPPGVEDTRLGDWIDARQKFNDLYHDATFEQSKE